MNAADFDSVKILRAKKVHTHKHDGKYEEAGSHADIEQSQDNTGQNAAGTNGRKEQ